MKFFAKSNLVLSRTKMFKDVSNLPQQISGRARNKTVLTWVLLSNGLLDSSGLDTAGRGGAYSEMIILSLIICWTFAVFVLLMGKVGRAAAS